MPKEMVVGILLVLFSALAATEEDLASELVGAAEKGQTEIVRALLEAGADANARDADGVTALMKAVSGGHTGTVRTLLEAGVEVDVKDRDSGTPLIIATKQGHARTARALLEAGAKVDARDNMAKTSLMYAAMFGHIHMAQLLLEAGADASKSDNGGVTVLMRAAVQGHTDIVRVLMDSGADVNTQSRSGKTALMFAAKHGHTETVKALLDGGASVNAKDKRDETALMESALGGHNETVRLLLNAGADAKNRKAIPEGQVQPPAHETAIAELLESVTTPSTPDLHFSKDRSSSEPHLVADSEFSPTRTDAYWTDFRGPNRDGRYAERRILTEWPADGLPLLWHQPVGGGYASFVVANGRAFTIEQRSRQEVVTAYDMETGRELWAHSRNAEFRESVGGDGPRATPVWDEGLLYALGATGTLNCLQAATGKPVWTRNILTENAAKNIEYGMASSPLIVDDSIIVLPGGLSGKSVVAYHKLTGEPIWESLSDRQAYTAPMLVKLAGRRQILVVSALRAMGLAIEDGSLLWDYPWETPYDVNAAQPIIVSENRFFISAGYGHGAAVVEVSKAEQGLVAHTVWQNKQMKNKFSSSVLYEKHVYGLDERILACVDIRTGERRWKGGRYGYGQVLLASEHLIVLTEFGDVVLVKATPESHQELARFSALKGKTWNHPAVADGRLLVRNASEMACFDLRAP